MFARTEAAWARGRGSLLGVALSGVLGVLGLGGSGCADLWGRSTTPNPDNCARSGCPDGQVCDADRQVCVAPVDLGAPDLSLPDLYLGPAATSYYFPAIASPIQLPIAVPFQLATWDASTILYTLDGSEPVRAGASTISGASPARTAPIASGTLSWRADAGPYSLLEAVQQRTVATAAAPESLGALGYDLRFTDSGGPLLTVAPGARVTGTVAYRAWRSSPTGYCPGCFLQLVMVVPSVGIPSGGCVDGVEGFGPFPGVTGEIRFDFTAPMQPGEYAPFLGLTLQFTCDGAQPGSGVAVGRLRVR